MSKFLISYLTGFELIVILNHLDKIVIFIFMKQNSIEQIKMIDWTEFLSVLPASNGLCFVLRRK